MLAANTHLAIPDGLAGNVDTVWHLGGDTQVLEEALVGGPELAPHALS